MSDSNHKKWPLRRVLKMGAKFLALCVLVGLVLVAVEAVLFVYFPQTEFALTNETIYSSKFSWTRWEQIRLGSSKNDVVRSLGKPLDFRPWWACLDRAIPLESCETRLWAVPRRGYGYFAQLRFKNEKVDEIKVFEDD